jgi:hypothetical protein
MRCLCEVRRSGVGLHAEGEDVKSAKSLLNHMLEAKEKPAAEAEGQRRANGTFEHGHQLSVGNRGGMATRVRRNFISHCLIVTLHESIQRQSDGRFMKGIENLVKQFERGDLAVIKFVTERFEGVLPIDLTISGPNGGLVKTITATMSAEEAAAAYAATITAATT